MRGACRGLQRTPLPSRKNMLRHTPQSWYQQLHPAIDKPASGVYLPLCLAVECRVYRSRSQGPRVTQLAREHPSCCHSGMVPTNPHPIHPVCPSSHCQSIGSTGSIGWGALGTIPQCGNRVSSTCLSQGAGCYTGDVHSLAPKGSVSLNCCAHTSLIAQP